MSKAGAISGTSSITFRASATLDARRGFSLPHLAAADHFATALRDHEAAYAGAGWGDHFSFCTWNASAAIILSYAAVDASVDEIEDELSIAAELSDAFKRTPTLDRIQALLVHKRCAPFAKGKDPYQSIDLLRDLRNGLVHPKAEWDSDPKTHKKLGSRIIGAGLGLSPFQQDRKLAFPYGCMSADVAAWAAVSARLFIREMRFRFELPVSA